MKVKIARYLQALGFWEAKLTQKVFNALRSGVKKIKSKSPPHRRVSVPVPQILHPPPPSPSPTPNLNEVTANLLQSRMLGNPNVLQAAMIARRKKKLQHKHNPLLRTITIHNSSHNVDALPRCGRKPLSVAFSCLQSNVTTSKIEKARRNVRFIRQQSEQHNARYKQRFADVHFTDSTKDMTNLIFSSSDEEFSDEEEERVNEENVNPSQNHNLRSREEEFKLCKLCFERSSKKRGLNALKRLLKKFYKTPNNFETNYVAAAKLHPTVAVVVHATPLLAEAAFKWISLTLPQTYSYSYNSQIHSTKANFIQSIKKISPTIMRSMQVKENGGVVELLHAQGLVDAKKLRKIFTELKIYVSKCLASDFHHRTVLLVRFFNVLRLYNLLQGVRRMRAGRLKRVMLMRGWKRWARFVTDTIHTTKKNTFFRLKKFAMIRSNQKRENNYKAFTHYSTLISSKAFYSWKKFLPVEKSKFKKLQLQFHFRKFSRRIQAKQRRKSSEYNAGLYYVNRQYFSLWRRKAFLKRNFEVFLARKQNACLRLVLNVMRATLRMGKLSRMMRGRNKEKITKRKLGMVFAGFKSYSLLRKRAMDIGVKRYIKLLRRVVNEWRGAGRKLREARLIEEYGAKVYYHIKGREGMKKWREFSKNRKLFRLGMEKSSSHCLMRLFAKFKGGVKLSMFHRAQLLSFLKHFTVQKKIFPAWKKYVATSLRIVSLGAAVNCRFCWVKWRKMVAKAKQNRMTAYAVNVYRDHDIKYRAFSGWLVISKRNKRLLRCKGLVEGGIARTLRKGAWEQWFRRTARGLNCRMARDSIVRQRSLKLSRGAMTIWRASFVYLRNTRLDVLQSIFTNLTLGFELARRAREGKELADRFLYVVRLRRGVEMLGMGARERRWERACGKACESLNYKARAARGLKGLRRNALEKKRTEGLGRKAVLFKGFKEFKKGHGSLKIRSDRKRVNEAFRGWKKEVVVVGRKKEWKAEEW